MYFDFLMYRKVLAFTWRHKDWPGRKKILIKLLVLTPIVSLVHAMFFVLDYVFYPALWHQQVKSPIFVVGHARSGTTLMHRLMAADEERFSYFRYWEMFFPSLTERAIVRVLAWIDRKLLANLIENRLRVWDEKTFGPTRHIHKQGLWIPEEDQFVMNAAFVTQQWALELPILHELDIFHIDKLSERRKKRWMHHYKECLKRHLLLEGGNKTHLSKNPAMSGWVDAIIDTFPDAKIVVVVRDPMQCIPSSLRMMESSWKAKKWRRDQYDPALDALTRISFDSYAFPAKALANRSETPHRFVDYRELTAAPRRTVESVYECLGFEMAENYASYLAAQEEREKKYSSKFRYDIEDYAVTPAQIEDQLDKFYDLYQWPRPSEQTAIAEK